MHSEVYKARPQTGSAVTISSDGSLACLPKLMASGEPE